MRWVAREKLLIALYAFLSFLFVPVYPHFVSPNEFSRWLTVSALMEEGTFEVSKRLPLIGGRNEDLSEIEGRLYSNKAPGAALLSLPGYALARLFVESTSFRTVLTAMRIVTSTLPLVLTALAFVTLARRWRSESAASAAALSTLLFATPLFAYSLLAFSHALVAATLFGAWMLLFEAERSRLRDAAAGMLLGLAVVSEYPAAIPAIAVVAVAAWPADWRRFVSVAAGALPFAVGLALYNAACFGGPFELSSGHERFRAFNELASLGVFGVSWPSPLNVGRLLFSPQRGLFFFSPILVVGMLELVRRRKEKSSVAALLAALSTLLFYAGYPNWHGGWTVGSRYLVVLIPFLSVGLLRREVTVLVQIVLAYSITAVMLTTLVFPFVPEDFPAPWGSFSLPFLMQGMAVPNLLGVSEAFVVGVAVVAVLMMTLPRTGTLGGVALALLVGVIALRLATPRQTLERAYVAEVYFEQTGLLRKIGAPPRLVRRAELEQALPPQPLD